MIFQSTDKYMYIVCHAIYHVNIDTNILVYMGFS